MIIEQINNTTIVLQNKIETIAVTNHYRKACGMVSNKKKFGLTNFFRDMTSITFTQKTSTLIPQNQPILMFIFRYESIFRSGIHGTTLSGSKINVFYRASHSGAKIEKIEKRRQKHFESVPIAEFIPWQKNSIECACLCGTTGSLITLNVFCCS